VELVNDNLFEWHVRLHQIDPESELAGDLRELRIPNILLHLVFPENFPFAPPFMRVIEPRIEKGFVMEGIYLHTYSRFIPEGIAETSQIFLRNTLLYYNYLSSLPTLQLHYRKYCVAVISLYVNIYLVFVTDTSFQSVFINE
jgi:hypothetical protein